MGGSKLDMLALQFGGTLQNRTGTLLLPINVRSWYGAVSSAPLHWVLVVIDTVTRCVMTPIPWIHTVAKIIRKNLGSFARGRNLCVLTYGPWGPNGE